MLRSPMRGHCGQPASVPKPWRSWNRPRSATPRTWLCSALTGARWRMPGNISKRLRRLSAPTRPTIRIGVFSTCKGPCMALQQSERYRTPLATMLRVMAQENRDMRMAEAEKKAAGLPPKLTVPLILLLPAGTVHRHSRSGRDGVEVGSLRFRRTHFASAKGSAVVDLIRSIANRDVTFFSGTVAISFL